MCCAAEKHDNAPWWEPHTQPGLRLPLKSMYDGSGEWPKRIAHGSKRYPSSNIELRQLTGGLQRPGKLLALRRLQSRNITEAVMRNFELTAEEIGLLDAGTLDLVGPGEESSLLRHAPRHDDCTASSIRGFRGSRRVEERHPVCVRIGKVKPQHQWHIGAC